MRFFATIYTFLILSLLVFCNQQSADKGSKKVKRIKSTTENTEQIPCADSELFRILNKLSFKDSALTPEERAQIKDLNQGSQFKNRKIIPSTGLIPLVDLGENEYKGFQGGLYPEGKNEPPVKHIRDAVEISKKVRPLEENGIPVYDSNGKIVFLTLGMSNTKIEFDVFQKVMTRMDGINENLVMINGAVPTQSAEQMSCDDAPIWRYLEKEFLSNGVSPAQVQVIWLKTAIRNPRKAFEKEAGRLKNEMKKIIQIAKRKYPNLQICYISSRTYAGYSSVSTNPEPYAYQSGFSVKWLIEEQINGDPALNYDQTKGAVTAPILLWGPYLWVDGTADKRPLYNYDVDFYDEKGLHPSVKGANFTASKLLEFLLHDPSTQTWMWDKL